MAGHQWPSVAISSHQWPSVVISGREWQPMCIQGSISRTALKHAKLSVSSFAEGKSPSSTNLGAHLMRMAIKEADEGRHQSSTILGAGAHLRLRSSLVYIVKWFVLLFPTMRRRCGSASGGRPRARRHAVRAAFLSGSGHSTHSDVASGAAGSDLHVTPQ